MALLGAETVPIDSLAPDAQDFSDLRPLVSMIGATRIVLLGEGGHGEGSTFLAKARLVRFLHQEMGFDVLAWESGLFDCEEVDRFMRGEASALQAARHGIFPVWSRSEQVRPVLEYVKATQSGLRPITTAGFDCRISSNATLQALPQAIFEYFERLDPGLFSVADRDHLQQLLARIAGHSSYAPNVQESRTNRDLLHRLIHNVALHSERVSAAQVALTERVLRNVLVMEERSVPRAPQNYPAVFNLRDQAMGENLLWLVRQRYPRRKIIVWAASLHIARDLTPLRVASGQSPQYAGLVPMGHYLHRALGEPTYTVGFVAYRGSSGWAVGSNAQPTVLSAPSPDSFVARCHQTGHSQLFVDLKGLPARHWLRGAFTLSSGAPARWSTIYDGLLFMEEMIPSTPLRPGI